MKYCISILMAAFIFAFLVFAFVYWVLDWAYNDAILLAIQTLLISIIFEAIRFFFLRKKADTK
ncbi:MAG: hypothetical protein IBJ16_15145 [Chitinophagaceae bacterium]|nr:hypothetical protein [Chitinophagaceae bacterium]